MPDNSDRAAVPNNSLRDEVATEQRDPAASEFLVQILAACIPINLLDRLLNRLRTARIKRQFASCGNRVALSSGLLVECPKLVLIGDDVSLGPDVSIMGAGGVTIRRGAMLATRTLILTTQHDPTDPNMRHTSVHARVEIGEFSWIGAGAILLPGVKVGDQAVIGAGALVSRDVPPYALAVGVPARVVRDRRHKDAAGGTECHGS